MLCNQMLCLDNVDSHLARVESFLVSGSASGDLTDPPSNSAQTPTLLSSYHD